ncbi:hypothetical protein Ade02nite_80030 [Paractinoplanes deccanensis]|uniref:Uncharacterized protein n=1 Tax=Paractinoplanes deccanensis TaxID=113561 RepID=A0ABQ3YH99_9ACTN|nr:hypothetical protein [Actinoplanes deccanensis]GID79362.1 hypothetical protein Ade02nite_80030 [Actinoplanes deccanensis]
MELRTRLLIFRCDYLLRRANHRRRRRLAAELASYTSHAELNELYAVLDTYPDGQTHEIRQILRAQAIRRGR